MQARRKWLLVGLILVLATAVPLLASAQSEVTREVQERLTTFGYDPGPADGLMGPKTRSALRAFQEKSGLPVTGEADTQTLSALGVPTTTTPATDGTTTSTPQPTAAAQPPPVSQPLPSIAQGSTENLVPRTPSGRVSQTSTSRPLDAEPEDGFSKWWLVAGGLALFFFWRSRKRKSAATSEVRDPRSDVLARGEMNSVDRSTPRPPVARWRSTSQDGNDFWVPAGKSKSVGGHDIGGMVYVGRGLRGQRSGRAENCLIDPSLPVAKRNADYAADHMPYWPSYSEVPPSSRLAYLRWLSSGRSDPEAELGYVFLYFYGLERRLFLDRPSDEEKTALIAELQRLRDIYGWNRSFDRYSGALLDAADIMLHGDSDSKPDPQRYLDRSGWELPLSLKLGLGRQLNAGRTLNGEWLLCWWLAHPETRLRTPAKRAFGEFSSLFLIRFAALYPDGLKVTKPKRRLSFSYRAASGSFERDFRQELSNYPDVERLTKPVNTAAALAERCMDDLDAYSRYLGRKPHGRGSIEAHVLLPEELAAAMPSTELESLREWVGQQITHSHGIVPVETVLERLEGEAPTRISRRALISAADALARISIGLAPDPRFAIRAPKAREPVMLFRLPGKLTKLEDVCADYAGALLSIVLGTYIAHADGSVSSVERQRLKAQIDRMTNLSDSERARLHANLTWMIAVPPKLGQLRKHFDSIDETQKQAIGQLAIAVAGADGVIDPAEVDAVRKLYRAMGLSEEQVYGDLHQMAAAPATEPVTVVKVSTPPRGYSIPNPLEEPSPAASSALQLDHDRISSIMADTQRASKVLSEIFSDDVADDDTGTDEAEEKRSGLVFHEGLDGAHRAFVEELLTQPAWTEGALGQLVKQFGLMAEGAIETVNEWAFEHFDDALLEEDGDFLVNLGIVEALQIDKRGTTDDATQHQTA